MALSFLDTEMFREIELALNEIGAEILYIDLEREVIKINVDIRLRSQAFLIVEDIRKKYAEKEIRKRVENPFIRIMEIFEEIN
jgi:hypothetical protein